jgi:hypothetical protein
MAQIKTVVNEASVEAFIEAVPDERKRRDCLELIQMMQRATGMPAKMWGPAIIGFGSRHYRYESGREGDMPQIGFSPRKKNLALYCLLGTSTSDELRTQLGTHETGKGCLYIKRLDDVNLDVLARLLDAAVQGETPEPAGAEG